MTVVNTVMWGPRHSTADWLCSKTLRLCWRPWGLKINLRWCLVFFFFGSRTFVPVCWMCKEQSSVLHSSTESEVIFLDAGLRMYGLLALDLWDIVTEVIHSTNDLSSHTFWPPGNWGSSWFENQDPTCHKKQKVDQLSEADHLPTNTHSSQGESQLYIFFEDNEAVIKMTIKDRSLTKRHAPRIHRVALDWLFDRINLEPKREIKFVNTKNQLADILTQGDRCHVETRTRRNLGWWFSAKRMSRTNFWISGQSGDWRRKKNSWLSLRKLGTVRLKLRSWKFRSESTREG